MSHGGHFVASGPSAKRFMSGSDMNLDPETAAFVAAHCSPFVGPTQLDVNPKIPDTKTHANTAYAYLHAEFQIPVQNISSSGELLLGTVADPLAPLPVWWGFDAGSCQVSPNEWAKKYLDAGLGPLMAQCKTLGEVSRKHRVVGHAIRANAGRNTTIERGLARGGHYLMEDTRQQTNSLGTYTRYLDNPVPAYEISSMNSFDVKQVPDGVEFAVNEFTYPINQGLQGQLLMGSDTNLLRASIRDAKENECTGKADDGMSVRWTPVSGFEFQKTVNRHVVVPTNVAYSNGYPVDYISTSSAAYTLSAKAAPLQNEYGINTAQGIIAGTSAVPLKNRTAYFSNTRLNTVAGRGAHNVYDICVHPIDTQGAATYPTMLDTLSELGTIRHVTKSGATGTGGQSGTDGDGVLTYSLGGISHIFYAADQDAIQNGCIHIGNNRYMKYTEAAANFERGCFIDMSGLDPAQIINVEVVWHIEFMPKDYHLNPGRPSPINLEWDTILAAIGNEQAFPLVAQGNSFFSSLWKGIKKAGRLGTKIAKVAAPIVGSIPSPYAQGAAAALGTGATVGTLMFE